MAKRNKMRFFRPVYLCKDTHEYLKNFAKEHKIGLQDLTEKAIIEYITNKEGENGEK